MFALVQDLFGAAHQELFEEFKLLMATRANYDAQPSDMWCVPHTHTAAPDPCCGAFYSAFCGGGVVSSSGVHSV